MFIIINYYSEHNCNIKEYPILLFLWFFNLHQHICDKKSLHIYAMTQQNAADNFEAVIST